MRPVRFCKGRRRRTSRWVPERAQTSRFSSSAITTGFRARCVPGPLSIQLSRMFSRLSQGNSLLPRGARVSAGNAVCSVQASLTLSTAAHAGAKGREYSPALCSALESQIPATSRFQYEILSFLALISRAVSKDGFNVALRTYRTQPATVPGFVRRWPAVSDKAAVVQQQPQLAIYRGPCAQPAC